MMQSVPWHLAGLILLLSTGTATGAVRLDLSTDPSGADAWAGDRYLGRTPLSIEIPAGTTLLRVADASDSLLWRAPAKDTLLHAEDGETLRIGLRIGRTYAIRSMPIGLPVMMGGVRVGQTPLELRAVAEELGRLSLKTPNGPVPVPPESLLAHGSWIWRGGHVPDEDRPDNGRSRLRRLGRYVAPLLAGGLAAAAIMVENSADRSYERYLSTADPSRVARYYDDTQDQDALSTALWVGAEVALAATIVAWILPERSGAPVGDARSGETWEQGSDRAEGRGGPVRADCSTDLPVRSGGRSGR